MAEIRPTRQVAAGWHRPRVAATTPLPPELSGRFPPVSALPAGGEADVWHVRDGEEHRVLKWYRAGVLTGEALRERAALEPKLRGLDPAFALPLLDRGTVAGRYWELYEYLPGGSLGDLIAERGRPFTTAETLDLIRQVNEILAYLQELRLAHGDVTPQNLLLRGRTPMRLAIADFGLTIELTQGIEFRDARLTGPYAAPEAMMGARCRQSEHWSLGMIAAEVAGGEHPYGDFEDPVIMFEVGRRPVPLDLVTDERVRAICSGLLVRDTDHRWGVEKVRAALAGNPPPPWREEYPNGAWPLPVAGRDCFDPAQAAVRMATHWDRTCADYLSSTDTLGRDDSALSRLCAWMAQFGHDADRRRGVVDNWLNRPDRDPSERLLHLLGWLAEGRQPPVYRGRVVLFSTLAELSRDEEFTAELWDRDLLPVLAGFQGGEELAEVREDWHWRVDRWASIVPSDRAAEDPAVRAMLLRGIADPAFDAELTDRVGRRAASRALWQSLWAAIGFAVLALAVSGAAFAVAGPGPLPAIWLAAGAGTLLVLAGEAGAAYADGWRYTEASRVLRLLQARDRLRLRGVAVRAWIGTRQFVGGLLVIAGVLGAVFVLFAFLSAMSWVLVLAPAVAHTVWTASTLSALPDSDERQEP